jgi:hypothetical protein
MRFPESLKSHRRLEGADVNGSHESTGCRPIHVDVEGAPFKIGDLVVVTCGSDETFDCYYEGRVGTVEYFEYECGCGQSYPRDPMIGVRFGTVIDEFWREELKLRRNRLRSAGAENFGSLTDSQSLGRDTAK